MSGVEILEVKPDEAGMRLDRWFRAHYPRLAHGALQKLLRTGQVRVDGARAKAGQRLECGQAVRVPPLAAVAETRPRAPEAVSAENAAFVQSLVLHCDADIIAIDKPAGLAVQGGSGTERHLDAMLEALRFGADERPRLVHRLDRDTSGLMVLARNRAAATRLGRLFKSRNLKKIYWALVAGQPRPAEGLIDLALVKAGHAGDQRVRPARAGESDAQAARTLYRTLDHAGRKAAWLALWPRTGRTHQLRAHLAAIGHPILGDGKYGGREAFIAEELAPQPMLHARELTLPRAGGGELRLVAPLPEHMRAAFAFFGFEAAAGANAFEEESA